MSISYLTVFAHTFRITLRSHNSTNRHLPLPNQLQQCVHYVNHKVRYIFNICSTNRTGAHQRNVDCIVRSETSLSSRSNFLYQRKQYWTGSTGLNQATSGCDKSTWQINNASSLVTVNGELSVPDFSTMQNNKIALQWCNIIYHFQFQPTVCQVQILWNI